jgi:hypothetical protein
VKLSGREEPVLVAINMCMEAMPGISLYSYLYLKLGKCYVFFYYYYLLCFFFNKSREQEGGKCSAQKRGWGGGHTHVSKCKNDKNNKTLTLCPSL